LSDILIGVAGWAYKDWEGIVYPPQLKKKQHPVEYLAQYFDAIEINNSFYGHIKPEIGRLWATKAAAVNPNFLFTAKLNKTFTHSPIAVVESTSAATIKPNPEDEKLAKEGLDSIAREGRLGALLLQFPVSFKNTNENRAYLDWLLERFAMYRRVVEVRHGSWNDQPTLAHFTEEGVGFCNIDQPVIGQSLGRTTHVTSPLGYVRLHGRRYDQWFTNESSHERYNYLYKRDELARWKPRIESIVEKAEKTFVIANNHYEGKAAVNALELKSLLTGGRVKAPPTLVNAYPELETIAEVAPAEDLFQK
jgi:uncharacterized protein YecE (DUF72 family)